MRINLGFGSEATYFAKVTFRYFMIYFAFVAKTLY